MYLIIIRPKENIANTLMGQKNGLHSFGYNFAESEPIWMNLEYCEPNVDGWLWQILGAIRAVAIVWEGAEILFFCEVNNTRFQQFLVVNILRHLKTTTSIGVAM